MKFSALLYDVEIVNCIPPAPPGLKACGGWRDFAGMGISVLACYDFQEDAYRIFMQDNLHQFHDLAVSRDHIIGFNSVSFDDKLCQANGIKVHTTYDLLREVRLASGQPADYVQGVTRAGYSLECLALANLGVGKSGSGELAPELWQMGSIGAVVDYCLSDCRLTKILFEMAQRGELKDPTTGEVLRNMRRIS